MRGYLLDTNIIIYWHNPKAPEHDSVTESVAALDANSYLYMSAISWGEMEYGHRAVSDVDSPEQTARNAFVERELPYVIDVRRTTSLYYGQLRARLFNRYAPQRKRRKGLRPEQLADPVTALELGIQENDLWIAAQAFEHNLVLVAGDKLDRIQSVIGDLVTIENWTMRPGTSRVQ